VDLFCGAGGTSTGILKAARERLKREVKLIAVNHWTTAINSHSLNHPGVEHICESVENLHPMDVIKSRRLKALAASCECRFHCNAAGGRPCKEQSRSQAWQLIRWATDIDVENILMENVREFMDWGPLLNKPTRYKGRYYRKDRPDPRRKGEFFRAFVATLRSMGYQVDYRMQCAADFGDPTSRQRLILIAQRGAPIVWPEPTHGPGRSKSWESARGCIDWGLKGTNIFDRERLGLPALCENTINRIAAGLKKFGGEAAEPFLMLLNGTSKGHISASAKSLDDPMPTVVASGNHIVLCEPFVIGQQSGAVARSVDEPLPTVATKGAIRVCEPFVMHLTHRGSDPQRCHSVDNPLPTVTAAHRGEMALIEPFITQTDQTGGNGAYSRPVSRPLGTVVSKQNMLLVEPLLMKYYRTGRCKPVDMPLDTVTTKPRFLLVEFDGGTGVAEFGIRTRLLQPHELARAHSFPKSYKFTGNKEDQTTQIGNSVPVELAAAHAEVVLR
jgi:DNA (cytosine-5)-methyltransferase 1